MCNHRVLFPCESILERTLCVKWKGVTIYGMFRWDYPVLNPVSVAVLPSESGGHATSEGEICELSEKDLHTLI